MTEAQEQHLARLKEAFSLFVDGKYRRGQAEHGGNLFDLSALELLNAAIDETVDQFTYLQTLKDRLLEHRS